LDARDFKEADSDAGWQQGGQDGDASTAHHYVQQAAASRLRA